MGLPHVLALPFPAQGHVIPLMELCYCLVDHGCKVTFVNTEVNHKRVIAALSAESTVHQVDLVSVPDGVEAEEDRNDLARLTEAILNTMPRCLEDLIEKSNETADPMTCMLVDKGMGWALEVGRKKGLRSAAFYPASAQMAATLLSLPELISRGVIDADGTPVPEHETFQLGPGMPSINAAHLMWNVKGDGRSEEIVFNYFLNSSRVLDVVDFIVCNSFKELEEPTFSYAPKILPIGPLLTGLRPSWAVGHFWPEDAACLSWLDEQPPGSVVYVAFGSFTVLDRSQFQELALGLEATGRPFLLVIRPDLTGDWADAYLDEFKDRVGNRGMMVAWAPQQNVLAHPSVGCFVSHCGWNSTMEGVRNGKLFLCWPYFVDQFLNQSYICDHWKVGLSLTPDENGIVQREQLKSKVEELLGDAEMRARASLLKEKAQRNINPGGASFQNLKRFIDAIKANA
ncbi:UDP-glycosyltransferase 83A1-like [Curcuma longa]|uniref:UDP-glycosyltransferase 83A1-like n=1 Tax=Curcuma longa TaxID=136217 RepID=UPI003D9DCDD9